jgi:glycosyltransferase involved in cell wall biosynthesis
MKNVCFFARVPDPKLFDIVGFYRDDVDSLVDFGYKVTKIHSLIDLFRRRYDAYYVWWFGYGIVPAVLAILFDRPVIVTGAIHTENCGSISDWPFFKRILMKMTMKFATLSLFISKTDFAKLDGFTPKKSAIVYCAINLDKYKPADRVNRNTSVMTISHLTEDNVRRKKIFDCIEAFSLVVKIHHEARYWIVGRHGDAYDAVTKLIDDLGLSDNVLLLGPVSDEEKIRLLQEATVYLQPSLCEGFGLAILEAKACGAPVVTSSESCILEINGDSVLYADNVNSISSHILNLIEDKELHSHYSKRGMASLSPYTLAERKNLLRSIIHEVFGN